MINISEDAQKYFVSLLSNEPEETQIRIFIVNAGRSDAECRLAFCSKNEIEISDISLRYEKFLIYVNKDIIAYLKNSQIDLITDKLGSQLTLKAPYAKHNFSKHQHTLKDKIVDFLNLEINPQLSIHGGKVNLIEMNQASGLAIIQFSGGCNGCSMIGLTLKETVEKKLLSSFPEIKKVSDQTEHLHGKHSFY